MLPEVREAVRAIGTGKCGDQARFVIEVGHDHFDPEGGERLGLLGVGIAGYRANTEPTIGVRKDRASEAAPLGTGGAGHGNDLESSLVHWILFICLVDTWR